MLHGTMCVPQKESNKTMIALQNKYIGFLGARSFNFHLQNQQ